MPNQWMHNYNFTVVIGTYNQAHILPYVFDALHAQTYKNFDVIVCDDGSKDDTIGLCQKEKRFPLTYFTWENKGMRLAASLNRGFKDMKGDYVVCFMGDSIPKNDLLFQYNRYAYPNVLVSGIREYKLKPEGEVVERDWRLQKNFDKMNGVLNPWVIFTGNNWCAHKSIFDEIGYWDELYQGYGCDDIDFAMRASLSGIYQLYPCEKAIVYHIGPNVNQSDELNKKIYLEKYRRVFYDARSGRAGRFLAEKR